MMETARRKWCSNYDVDELRKKRRPNYSVDELNLYVDLVSAYRNTLFGKHTPTRTSAVKIKTWKFIGEQLYFLQGSTVRRSGEELRRKWRDWASVVKKKRTKCMQGMHLTEGAASTGLLQKEDLTELELKVLSVLGKTTDEDFSSFIDSEAEIDTCPEATYKWPSTSYEESHPTTMHVVKNEIEESETTQEMQDLFTGESCPVTFPIVEDEMSGVEPTQIVGDICSDDLKKRKFSQFEKMLELKERKLKLKERKLNLMEESNDLQRSILNKLTDIADRITQAQGRFTVSQEVTEP